MNFGVGLINDKYYDLLKVDMLLPRNRGVITMGPILTSNITAEYIKTTNVSLESQVPVTVGLGVTTVTVNASELERPVIITSTATLPGDFSLVMPNVSDITQYLTTANTNLSLQWGDSFKISIINLNTDAGHAVFANTTAADVFVPTSASDANSLLPQTITEFTYIIDPSATPPNGIVMANMGVSKSYADSQLAIHVNNSTSAHFGQDLTSTGSAILSTLSLTSTTVSTSTSTGALIIAGGAAVGGQANVRTLGIGAAADTTLYMSFIKNASPTIGQLRLEAATTLRGLTIYAQDDQTYFLSDNKYVLNGGDVLIDSLGTAGSYSEGALIVLGDVSFSSKLNVQLDAGIGAMASSTCRLYVKQDTTATCGMYLENTGADYLSLITGSSSANLMSNLPVAVGTTLLVTNTDDATSSAGSAVLSGGLLVQKSAYINGSLSIASGFSLAGSLTVGSSIGSTGILHVYATTVSTSTSTGALIASGGGGFGGAINCSGLRSYATADTTSTGSSSMQADGGLYVAKSAYIGSNLSIASGLSIAGALTVTGSIGSTGIVHVYATTASTSTSTGALIASGGGGFGGAISCSGLRSYATADTTSTGSSSLQADGGLYVAKSAYIASNLSIASGLSIAGAFTVTGSIGSTGIVHVYATTASTSTSTGALIASGGGGFGGAINCSGLHSYATTASTTTSTGSLIVDGGLGLAGSMVLGGGITFNLSTGGTALDYYAKTTLAGSWGDAWTTPKAQTIYLERIGSFVAMYTKSTIGGNIEANTRATYSLAIPNNYLPPISGATGGSAYAHRIQYTAGVQPSAARINVNMSSAGVVAGGIVIGAAASDASDDSAYVWTSPNPVIFIPWCIHFPII